MSVPNPAPATPPAPLPSPAPTPAADPAPAFEPAHPAGEVPAPTPRSVPYERFAEVTAHRRFAEAAAARAAADLDAARKQAADLQAQIAAFQSQQARAAVAAEFKLTAEQAKYLQGATADELKASAQALMAAFVPAPPVIDAGPKPAPGQPAVTPAAGFTLDQLRDPTFYQANKPAILAALAAGRIAT